MFYGGDGPIYVALITQHLFARNIIIVFVTADTEDEVLTTGVRVTYHVFLSNFVTLRLLLKSIALDPNLKD